MDVFNRDHERPLARRRFRPRRKRTVKLSPKSFRLQAGDVRRQPEQACEERQLLVCADLAEPLREALRR